MTVSVDFTARRANNLVFKDKTELTVLVPNQRWQTPHKFVEKSLCVYENGQTLDRVSDNGFVVLSDQTFELREPLRTNHVMFVSYLES